MSNQQTKPVKRSSELGALSLAARWDGKDRDDAGNVIGESALTKNSNNPTVISAVRLGCIAPVFTLACHPDLAQCWLDRAEWLIARHAEMTAPQRARAIRECDVYSGGLLARAAERRR